MKPSLLTYYAYRMIGLFVPLIPLAVGHRIADWAGNLAARVRPRERAYLRANMHQVLGPDVSEQELDRMAYATYRYMMRNYFDLFWIPGHPVDQILPLVEVRGEEYLRRTLESGSGVIVASMHYGAPEMMIHMVAALGVGCVVPAEHLQPERLFQYISALRKAHGVHLVPADGPLMELARALRRGEVVGLAVDRDTTHSGRLVQLFGRQIRLPDGAAILAVRTGTPVIACVSRHKPDGTYSLHICPPISFAADRRPDDDTIESAMREILRLLEREVAKDPSQWVVFRPVWNNS